MFALGVAIVKPALPLFSKNRVSCSASADVTPESPSLTCSFANGDPSFTPTLPDEVIDVKRLYRRGIGTNSGGGTNFDPFDVAFNNMYMLQAGQIGGLAVFDAFAQYKETIGRAAERA